MNWGVEDFVAAGLLLAMVAGCFLLARRWWSQPAYLAGLAVAVGAGLVTAWVSLAVGIIGAEGNPAGGGLHGRGVQHAAQDLPTGPGVDQLRRPVRTKPGQAELLSLLEAR